MFLETNLETILMEDFFMSEKILVTPALDERDLLTLNNEGPWR